MARFRIRNGLFHFQPMRPFSLWTESPSLILRKPRIYPSCPERSHTSIYYIKNGQYDFFVGNEFGDGKLYMTYGDFIPTYYNMDNPWENANNATGR